MAKRTLTSPLAVQYQIEDGRWMTASYENSDRMGRRAARNFMQHHHKPVRVIGNPNNEYSARGVVFTVKPDDKQRTRGDNE